MAEANLINIFRNTVFHVGLYVTEKQTGLPLRLAFTLLLLHCDNGAFVWDAAELKDELMPYDAIDFGQVLDALSSINLIAKTGDGAGIIPDFDFFNKPTPP